MPPLHVALYNRLLLTSEQRERVDVVLVSPRNPLNIGAVARAMANFGFSHLTVAAPYAPHWSEAKSAIGAAELLQGANRTASLADAIAQCTFVAGTGTLEYRKPEQVVFSLEELGSRIEQAIHSGGRVALVFGPEKHGLTREDLSHCHALVTIPTHPQQPSMNLGQSAAVCLYELVRPTAMRASNPSVHEESGSTGLAALPDSAALERLGDLIGEVMSAAEYSPAKMREANRHDVRLLLRRVALDPQEVRRAMGLFRRILWRLQRAGRNQS